jgi:DNA polymerase III delta prime subunit
MTDGKKSDGDNTKKLTRVLSTKLSIEDDILLQQVTTVAYRNGEIKEPTKSELVRFLITLLLSSVRKEQERLSLLANLEEVKLQPNLH